MPTKDSLCAYCRYELIPGELHYPATTTNDACLVVVQRPDNTYYLKGTQIYDYLSNTSSTNAKPSKPASQTPEGQGKRDKIRPRHDLIPLEFLDELASIFEEGRRPRPNMPEGYGDSWKLGGKEFVRDCLNHASNHLFRYMNGDLTENQLAKVAWNVLVVRYHDLQIEKEEKLGLKRV